MKINRNDQIMIIGGDKRQYYLFRELDIRKYNVFSTMIPGLPDSDFIGLSSFIHTYILPIPYSKDKHIIYGDKCKITLDEFFYIVEDGVNIIGGGFDDKFIANCKKKNIQYYDLLKDNIYSRTNCIGTAESSISQAILNSPLNLSESSCLVTGFGKCGSEIAKLLKGFTKQITICERNKSKSSEIISLGYKHIYFSELKDCITEYKFIFNTVPSLVLTHSIIENACSDAVITDIASAPGGTDFEYCKVRDITANLYSSLPGRFSPKACALAMVLCIT
ncbi:MAG: hypothetical protein IIT48_00830 [Lachnospiraceae bacterium]|nr:hypothetical protein [Lachnospiraceae bacterium]